MARESSKNPASQLFFPKSPSKIFLPVFSSPPGRPPTQETAAGFSGTVQRAGAPSLSCRIKPAATSARAIRNRRNVEGVPRLQGRRYACRVAAEVGLLPCQTGGMMAEGPRSCSSCTSYSKGASIQEIRRQQYAQCRKPPMRPSSCSNLRVSSLSASQNGQRSRYRASCPSWPMKQRLPAMVHLSCVFRPTAKARKHEFVLLRIAELARRITGSQGPLPGRERSRAVLAMIHLAAWCMKLHAADIAMKGRTGHVVP